MTSFRMTEVPTRRTAKEVDTAKGKLLATRTITTVGFPGNRTVRIGNDLDDVHFSDCQVVDRHRSAILQLNREANCGILVVRTRRDFDF